MAADASHAGLLMCGFMEGHLEETTRTVEPRFLASLDPVERVTAEGFLARAKVAAAQSWEQTVQRLPNVTVHAPRADTALDGAMATSRDAADGGGPPNYEARGRLVTAPLLQKKLSS